LGKWIILLVVAAALIGGGVWRFGPGHGSSVQYQTAAIVRSDLTNTVTASGQLSPVVNVQVGAQISGRITTILADFNSVVKSNQVIAQIDPSPYEIAVLKSEADLANARANQALNEVQARRADSLFTNDLISASDHDTAIAQLLQAKAQVQSSEADLKNAQVQLSYCTIYAPVNGVVISRNVDIGQTVASSFNTPTLFVIAGDLTKMQIDALVSEADIGGVEVGQRVVFNVDAFPYRNFNGTVSQIRYGPVTNQNVVNYDCVVAVNNSDLKLLPGMTANVYLITAERKNVLKIPNAALRLRPLDSAVLDAKTNTAPQTPAQGAAGSGQGSDKTTVRTAYLLDRTKDSKHPELKAVKIKVGINDGMFTEVIEGLNEGDQVVTSMISTAADSRPSNPFGPGGFRR
jgi:HlyD family secretion protein